MSTEIIKTPEQTAADIMADLGRLIIELRLGIIQGIEV